MRLSSLVVGAGLATCLLGCPAHHAGVAVIALVDFSGSISPSTIAFYSNAIHTRVWDQLSARDRVVVLPVDSRAESKADPFFSQSLDTINFTGLHDGVAHADDSVQARIAAFKKSKAAELDSGIGLEARTRSGFSGGTDLIGAIHSAALAFPDTGQFKGVLLIFSDMVQESAELNLKVLAQSGEAGVPALIKRLEEKHRIPRLPGVTVVIVGAGETEASATDGNAAVFYRAVRLFWIDFFKRAGATLDERHYGYRTQDLIPGVLHPQ